MSTGARKSAGRRWKASPPFPRRKKALAKLQDKRDNNRLPILKRTPKLADYTKTYFEYYQQVKDAKRPATIVKEWPKLPAPG